jgi:hypothetical protein
LFDACLCCQGCPEPGKGTLERSEEGSPQSIGRGSQDVTRAELTAELAASNPHLRRSDAELTVETVFDRIIDAVSGVHGVERLPHPTAVGVVAATRRPAGASRAQHRTRRGILKAGQQVGAALQRFVVLIHGNAKGADTLAKRWAVAHSVWHLPFEPDWQTHGDLAGPIRNRRMLDEGKPDLVLAFPGGRGTRNMVVQAKLAGVPVEIVAGDVPLIRLRFRCSGYGNAQFTDWVVDSHYAPQPWRSDAAPR